MRNCNIDLLKILSCVAVIGLHVFTYDYNNYFIDILHYMCGFAVPMFYMINGYLILNKEQITYKYCMHKILKIIKLDLEWNILLLVANLLIKHEIVNLPLNMVKDFLQLGFFWQFWFLGGLILIYLMLPLIHKIIRTDIKKMLLICALLGVICLLWVLLSFLGKKNLEQNIIQTFDIWTYLFYFMLGGVLHYFEKKQKYLLPIKMHIALLLILWVGFSLYQTFIGRNFINYGAYYNDLFAFFSNIFIFTGITKIRLSEKKQERIKKLSVLGLGCYIIHPILQRIINHIFVSVKIIYVPIYFILLVISSFLVTKLIRKMHLNFLVEL